MVMRVERRVYDFDRVLSWAPSYEVIYPAGKYFLKHAVRLTGKALFGNDWTGDEPLAWQYPFLIWPDLKHAHISVRQEARRIVQAHYPALISNRSAWDADPFGSLSPIQLLIATEN